MSTSIYQNAKELLRETKNRLKKEYGKSDKPAQRQALNDTCDHCIKEFNWYAMKGQISEKQAKMYANWLASYTGSLHP